MSSEMRLALLVGILLGAVSVIVGRCPLGLVTLIIGAMAMWYAGWFIVDRVYDKVSCDITTSKEG